MTAEEVLKNVACLYDNLQHAQNPAWVRPTDEEICEALKNILINFDTDYLSDIKAKKQQINEKLEDIYTYIDVIQRYCGYVESNVDDITTLL